MSMSMWTVYEHPTDYPDKYVARRFEIGNGVTITDDVIVEDSYIAIWQAMTDKHLVKLMRLPQDEPHIKECWI